MAARRPRGWWRLLLIGLVLAYVGLLVLWPLVAIVQGALAQGAGAFMTTFDDPTVRGAFALTLQLAAAAVVINAVFGVLIAWVLVRHRFRGRAFWNALVDLPFVVSPVIAGYMVILLFGRRGWFAPLLETIDAKVVFALPGMLLVTVFVSMPFVVRELMPVLQEIGPEPEQAAYTLGASGWQAFRHVTLPAIQWGLLYGITLTLARALGEFGAVLVVGGAITGRTETATLYIFRALEERQVVGAYAASVVLAVISFIVLIGMDALRRRGEEDR